MPDVPSGTSSESVYVWLDWLKESGQLDIFNNMYLVLKMFTIIPVTSCTCERIFSKLSIVKNKLRCTMGQDRLESLLPALPAEMYLTWCKILLVSIKV